MSRVNRSLQETGMFKRTVLVPAIIAALCVLVAPPLVAQSNSAGDRLLQEGLQLYERSSSDEDLKKAAAKYEEALTIFRKTGNGINEAQTMRNLGNVHYSLRESDKAKKCYQEALKIARQIGHPPTEGQALNNLGNIYKDDKQYSKAIEHYEKSLDMTRQIGDVQTEGTTLNNLGNAYRELEQYAKAQESDEKALEMARKRGDTKTEGQVLDNLGIDYKELRQYPKASECYEKSLEIKRRTGDFKGQGETLKSLGNLYRESKQYSRADEYLQRSLETARKVGDTRTEGMALCDLGVISADLGKYSQAVEYYEKSLQIKRTLGDSKEVGSTLTNLGLAYQELSEYPKAVKCHEEALEIQRKVGDPKGEGETLKSLGIVYRNQGQYAKAADSFEKSLEISRKVGGVKEEGQVLGNLGIVYWDWGQYAKATEYFEKSLKISRKVGGVKEEGQVLGNLGVVYRDWGQYAKAAEYLEKSLEIARNLGGAKEEGQVLGNLGVVYWDWGQYAKAAEYFEKSLEIIRKVGGVKEEGQILGNLGVVYRSWGQYAKAAEYHEKSLEISRKVGGVKEEGQVLGNLGIVYWDWGQYAKAAEYFEKSLEIIRKIGVAKEEGQVLGNLGVVYRDWGQYAKAAEYLEKSLEIARKLGGAKEEGQVLGNLGVVYRDWGQYAKAVEYFEKSLEIARKLGGAKEEGQIIGNLGVVYRDWGQYDNALVLFQEQLEIFFKIGVPVLGPQDLIGNLYLDRGEVEMAEPLLKKAGYWTSLGRLSLVKSDFQRAKEYYEKLRQSAEEKQDVGQLFTAYTGLGVAHEKMGDDEKAEAYFLKAVNLTEELRSSLSSSQRKTFFDVRINGFMRTAPYDGLARVRIRLKRPAEAFQDSEYTKARTFADALSKSSEGSIFDIPSDVLKQDQELTNQLAALRKRRQEAYEKANQEVISVVEPQVQEMGQKLQAHIRMLREKYPMFAATKYPEPMSIDQTALGINQWVLAYNVTDSGIIIYLTHGKHLIKGFFQPIPLQEINQLITRFREPMEMGLKENDYKDCNNKNITAQECTERKLKERLTAFDFASGKKLSDILLADILSNLPLNTPVIIIPDGPLGVIPFEMLVLNDGGKVAIDGPLPRTTGAEFFGDRNPISYYQSVTALTLARTLRNRPSQGEKLLALVDPVSDSDDPRWKKIAQQKGGRHSDALDSSRTPQTGIVFERLPLTGALGESLKNMYPSEIELYNGMDARKSVLLDKDLSPYRSIVFGTHGYFGKDLPGIQEPVLVLTLVDQPKDQNGFLRMTEVMGLKNLNCDIAALTACQTGLGKHISGEGTMGMGRAFQYAGAKSVLMSLWGVSDIASVNLVSVFLNCSKQGKDKLEALKLARDVVRKNGYDHPFYWASFILVGEAH
jgi:tetratricopeptide (TPR) repeat protein